MDEWTHHTLLGSKFSPHEEAVHIPFILRYPNKVVGNRRSDVLVNSVDVLPTLLGLCGIAVPDDVQGKNLSHTAFGTVGEEPDSVYLQILGPGWPPRTKTIGLWRAVRTHRYTYARWKDRGGLRVLYDRQTDPLELRNCIDDPEYAQVSEKMEARLLRWIEETGDPFDTGKRLPVTEMLDVGQTFTNPIWYEKAPQEYAAVVKTNEPDVNGISDSPTWEGFYP